MSILQRPTPRSLPARAPALAGAALWLGVLLATAGGCADVPSDDARVRAAVTALEARAPFMVRLPSTPTAMPAGCDGLIAAGDLVLRVDATPGVFAVYRGARPVCQDEAGLLADATLRLADGLGFDPDRDGVLPLDLLERASDSSNVKHGTAGGEDRLTPWLLRSAPAPGTATTDDDDAASSPTTDDGAGGRAQTTADDGVDESAANQPSAGDPFPQPSDGGGEPTAGDPFPQPSDGTGPTAGDPFPQPSDGDGGKATAGDPFPQPSDGGGGATAGDPFPQPSDGGGGATAGDPFPQPSDRNGTVDEAAGQSAADAEPQTTRDGDLGTRNGPCPDAEMAAMAEATHRSS